jgi:hypothetical protein
MRLPSAETRSPTRPAGERSSRRERRGEIESLRVCSTGDKRAECRISSEYAFPMPLTSLGLVSARFRVWFSRSSAAQKASKLHSSGSMPPGS